MGECEREYGRKWRGNLQARSSVSLHRFIRLSRPIDRGPTDRPDQTEQLSEPQPKSRVPTHFFRLFRYLIGQYVTVHGDVISHLNISVSKVKDGGLYSCVALNRAGSATHSSRLNLYGPPLIRPFPASGLNAVEGRAFVVHCPVAGFPIEEVAWKKGEFSSVPFVSRVIF